MSSCIRQLMAILNVNKNGMRRGLDDLVWPWKVTLAIVQVSWWPASRKTIHITTNF